MKTPLMFLAAGALLALGDARARAADGKTFFLTVSVSQYPKLSRFRPLDNADAAAGRLHAALLAQTPEGDREAYFLACGGDPAALPTVANIRAVLAHFAARARPADRVVLAFLVHGFENREGAALVAYDSDVGDPGSFLAVREVVGRVRAMRCKEACVLIDACRDYRDDLSVREVTDYQDPNDEARRKYDVLKAGATVVVQSCAEGQVAYERPGGAGLMTERLTEALTKAGAADANGDGEVTVREAVDYARKTVREDARFHHRASQTVSDLSSGEPFVLARVERTAPGGAPPGPALARGPLPYRSEEIPFGSPESPSSPARFAGNGSGGRVVDRPVVNAAVYGIPPGTPAGQALNFTRQASWGPGIPNPIPAQARQYIPQPGASLAGQIRRYIR